MKLNEFSDERVSEAERDIEEFLSRSIPVHSVEAVEADEVDAVTSSGADMREQLREYSIYIRIETSPLSKFDELDDRGSVHEHIRDQLEAMSMNNRGPDCLLVGTHHHPPHVDKSLIFFAEAVL